MKQLWILLVILFLLYIRTSTYASFPLDLSCNCTRNEDDIKKLSTYWNQVLLDEDASIKLLDPGNITGLRNYFTIFKTMKISHDSDIAHKITYSTLDVSHAYKYYSLAKSNFIENADIHKPVVVPLLPYKKNKTINKKDIKTMRYTKWVGSKIKDTRRKKLTAFGMKMYLTNPSKLNEDLLRLGTEQLKRQQAYS
jgi:hypothetical protein